MKIKLLLFYFISLLLFTNNVYAAPERTVNTQTKAEINEEEIIEIDETLLDKTLYEDFLKMLESDEIEYVYLNENSNDSKVFFNDLEGNFYYTDNPKYTDFRKDLLESGASIKSSGLIKTIEQKQAQKDARFSTFVAIGIFAIIILLAVWYSKKTDETSGKMTKLNTKKKKVIVRGKIGTNEEEISTDDENTKKFKDVAGLKEVKKDMESLVDFIKNADKYKEAGAKLPKGVILYGPPGTGKTLLAKAVAGEAGVPFYYMSGSDFIELYVGVGAKRVRQLFAEAKKHAPCIVFIDEIDAIGGKRTGHDSSGEERKTLNALLAEMDGFKSINNILVIGATNRLEDLDSALVRPGRFTNKYCVPLPSTPEERLEIINLYAKDKKFDESISFETLAKETIGCSPANIESLMNEAAIISVQDKKEKIDKESFDKAMMKSILNGHIRENQEGRDLKELELVAWHEAGHALIGKLFNRDVTKVTILSTTSGAGGVTFTMPSKMGLLSKEELRNQVKQLYGGRAAEYILYGSYEKTTTGASNDIEKATEVIHQLVTTYGMTKEYGLLNLNKLQINPKVVIDEEIKISKELEDETINLLMKNKDKLEKIAKLLLEKETIYSEDLDKIMYK